MPSLRAIALTAAIAAFATPTLADVATTSIDPSARPAPTLTSTRPAAPAVTRVALRQRCVRETIRVWSDYPHRFEERDVTICWPHP